MSDLWEYGGNTDDSETSSNSSGMLVSLSFTIYRFSGWSVESEYTHLHRRGVEVVETG